MGERLIRIEDGADGVRVLTLARPPVNALTNELLDELEGALDSVEWDGCAAAVLTGDGAFFSFGFDVPLLMTMEREAVHAFVERFCALYLRLFALDCPLVTAINGHATAGGCILAMTGDTRLMVEGRARIGLNEVRIGASIFRGVVRMLRFLVSGSAATRMLCDGELLNAAEASAVGLIDEAVSPERLRKEAVKRALAISENRHAMLSMKRHLRAEVAAEIRADDAESIPEFVDIWHSHQTQKQVAQIEIRS